MLGDGLVYPHCLQATAGYGICVEQVPSFQVAVPQGVVCNHAQTRRPCEL